MFFEMVKIIEGAEVETSWLLVPRIGTNCNNSLPAWYSKWAWLGWSAPSIVSNFMLSCHLAESLPIDDTVNYGNWCSVLYHFMSFFLLYLSLFCFALLLLSSALIISLLCSNVLPAAKWTDHAQCEVNGSWRQKEWWRELLRKNRRGQRKAEQSGISSTRKSSGCSMALRLNN